MRASQVIRGGGHAASEEGSAVREEFDVLEVARLHVLRQLLVQAPLAHHEGVIDRETVHLVHA